MNIIDIISAESLSSSKLISVVQLVVLLLLFVILFHLLICLCAFVTLNKRLLKDYLLNILVSVAVLLTVTVLLVAEKSVLAFAALKVLHRVVKDYTFLC